MSFKKFCEENKIDLKLNEPMKNHTTFKIGGNADFFVNIASVEQLKAVIKKANELKIPYFILGKGSNLLVSDKGIEGIVISLLNLNEVTVCGDEITVGAGVNLAKVCTTALENSLEGLEFAYGIPGSIGGALYMNAGAYGGEISQAVTQALCIDSQGNELIIPLNEMQLGYRTSVFSKTGLIVVSVKLKLKKGDKALIKERMEDFMCRRKSKQPLEYPSAGSTFKRPKGNFAGALIEKNGLKGMSVGGAMVSEKHAGFVINYNDATSKDVKDLMNKVKEAVLKADGIELEPEVIFVGRN